MVVLVTYKGYTKGGCRIIRSAIRGATISLAVYDRDKSSNTRQRDRCKANWEDHRNKKNFTLTKLGNLHCNIISIVATVVSPKGIFYLVAKSDQYTWDCKELESVGVWLNRKISILIGLLDMKIKRVYRFSLLLI